MAKDTGLSQFALELANRQGYASIPVERGSLLVITHAFLEGLLKKAEGHEHIMILIQNSQPQN